MTVSIIQLYFFVEGAGGLYISKNRYSGNDSQINYDACAMRDYIANFAADSHNATVKVYCDDSGRVISDCVPSIIIM